MGPSHDPSKSSPKFLFYGNKPGHILGCVLRFSLLSCLAGSMSLVLYTAFAPRQTHWFRVPEIHLAPTLAPVPDSTGETNISHILFGIGGSLKTWQDRRQYSSLWWEPNTTRGYVWLEVGPPKGASSWPAESIPYRVSENTTRFKHSRSPSASRIARIVLESFKLGPPEVRWFVMGDDDTVFFTRSLVAVLGKYDHREMWYVGGNSESVEQDVMHSYDMAFGGGGFAISYALAARLVDIFDGCLDRYSNFYGSDQRVWACVREIGVPLTRELGFHQFDIRGNPYGILSAHPIAPLVTLHHLDSVDPMFPGQTRIDSLKTLFSAYRIDPTRILQQSFCYDHKRKWSMALSWGYTIRLYPSLLTPNVLGVPIRTFKTWRTWSDGPFTFNTHPMSSDPCTQPVVYFMDTVGESGRTESSTSYKRYDSEGGIRCRKANYAGVKSVRRITVSATKMALSHWNKAPRRQCCEIVDRGAIWNGHMRLRIRKCRANEIITI